MNQGVLRLVEIGFESGDLWDILATYLGVKVKVVEKRDIPNYTDYFHALLHSRDFDVTLHNSFLITPERIALGLRFAPPTRIIRRCFAIANRQTSVQNWIDFTNFTNNFSPSLWLAAGATLLMLLIAGELTERHRRFHSSEGASSWKWLAGFFVQNGVDVSKTKTNCGSFAYKLMIVLCALTTVHTIQLYQGSMLAELIRPVQYEMPFNSVDDVTRMIVDGKAVLNLNSPLWPTTRMILHDEQLSPHSPYYRLREALLYHPPLFRDQTEGRIANLPDGRLIISVESEDFLLPQVSQQKCDIIWFAVDEQPELSSFVYSSTVNQSTKEAVDKAIVDNMEMIFRVQEVYRDRKIQQYHQCRQNLLVEQTPVIGDPIELIKLSPLLIVLVIGVGLAATMMAAEKFHVHYRNRNRIGPTIEE